VQADDEASIGTRRPEVSPLSEVAPRRRFAAWCSRRGHVLAIDWSDMEILVNHKIL
jgi:hypothetical protein